MKFEHIEHSEPMLSGIKHLIPVMYTLLEGENIGTLPSGVRVTPLVNQESTTYIECSAYYKPISRVLKNNENEQ